MTDDVITPHLIAPHGGQLKELLVDEARVAELKEQSRDWPSIDLLPRHLCDLELLLCGGLSPLRGFMDQASYESVISNMRLPDGSLWSIPITFAIVFLLERYMYSLILCYSFSSEPGSFDFETATTAGRSSR